MASWGLLGLSLTVCTGVCNLVRTRMTMPFSDWEESHARNNAGGGRRPMDEADVQAIIDRLGGVEALRERREEFREAVLRMNRERGALMELYPDQWVAVGRNGVIAVAGSLEDVFARVESAGLRDSEFEVEFLDTDPADLLL